MRLCACPGRAAPDADEYVILRNLTDEQRPDINDFLKARPGRGYGGWGFAGVAWPAVGTDRGASERVCPSRMLTYTSVPVSCLRAGEVCVCLCGWGGVGAVRWHFVSLGLQVHALVVE